MKEITIFTVLVIGITLLTKNLILTMIPLSLIGAIGFYLVSIMLNG